MFKPIKVSAFAGVLVYAVTAADVSSQSLVADPWQGVEPQVITEQQFQDVMNIMTSMRDANISVEVAEDATAEEQRAAVEKNAEALKVLSDAGYTPETFHPIVVNATIALSIAGGETQKKEIESAIDELKEQRAALTEEQYKQSFIQLAAQLSVIDRVPAENIALAAMHQSAFTALTSSD